MAHLQRQFLDAPPPFSKFLSFSYIFRNNRLAFLFGVGVPLWKNLDPALDNMVNGSRGLTLSYGIND